MQEDNNIHAQLEEPPSVKYNDNKPTNKKLFVRKGQNKETEQTPLQKSCSVSVYDSLFIRSFQS